LVLATSSSVEKQIRFLIDVIFGKIKCNFINLK
jgi:hypothetical protein